jgi:hypothetical protein
VITLSFGPPVITVEEENSGNAWQMSMTGDPTMRNQAIKAVPMIWTKKNRK